MKTTGKIISPMLKKIETKMRWRRESKSLLCLFESEYPMINARVTILFIHLFVDLFGFVNTVWADSEFLVENVILR